MGKYISVEMENGPGEGEVGGYRVETARELGGVVVNAVNGQGSEAETALFEGMSLKEVKETVESADKIN